MKKYIFMTMLWLMIPISVHAQSQDFRFEKTSQFNTPVVARPKAYDSAPVAIEENGITKVWYCGGGLPENDIYYTHDSVFYASFDANGSVVDAPRRVIAPSLNDTSVDGDHACAVTVVKQSHPAIDGGKEKYQMFYECAPIMYRREDGLTQGCYTEICHAVSDDGINWQRYNENIWATQSRFAYANEPPTSVMGLGKTWAGSDIVAGKGIAQNIGLSIDSSGKRTANFVGAKTCSDLGANYGTGHPTAITVNNQIWMWYYDSQGNTDNRAIYLAKSWDGMHFETPVKTNLQSPNKIKYVDVQVGTHNGFYVSSGAPFLMNIFNYSWDGINWFWSDQGYVSFYTDYLKNNFNLGSVTGCVTGNGVIVGDKYGYVKSLNINFLSQEGFFGKYDKCTATNGCKCYSPAEDIARGSTWDIYTLTGDFNYTGVISTPTPTPVPTPIPGDLNGDTHVDNTDYQLFLADFGKTGSPGFIPADINGDGKVDIFDYNVLVGNFGK